jgi:hypothetical protein
VYREVARPRRLVRTFVYAGAPDDESVEAVTLQRDGQGTLITSRTSFPPFAARNFYAQSGWRLGCGSLGNVSTNGLETIHNKTERRQ